MERNGELQKLSSGQARGIRVNDHLGRLFDPRSRLAIINPPLNMYPVAVLNYTPLFICETLRSVRAATSTLKMGPCVRKGSPLRPYFNYAIVQMKERGILMRVRRDFVRRTDIRCLEKDSTAEHRNIEFEDVFSAFVVLVVGAALATAVTTSENICWRLANISSKCK